MGGKREREIAWCGPKIIHGITNRGVTIFGELEKTSRRGNSLVGFWRMGRNLVDGIKWWGTSQAEEVVVQAMEMLQRSSSVWLEHSSRRGCRKSCIPGGWESGWRLDLEGSLRHTQAFILQMVDGGEPQETFRRGVMGSHSLTQSSLSLQCADSGGRGGGALVNEDVAMGKGKPIRKLWPRFRQERSSDLSRGGMSLHPQRAQTLCFQRTFSVHPRCPRNKMWKCPEVVSDLFWYTQRYWTLKGNSAFGPISPCTFHRCLQPWELH